MSAERQWIDMSADEIAVFLHLRPTYFMSIEEAGAFYAGVDASIRRDRLNPGARQVESEVRGSLWYVTGPSGYSVVQNNAAETKD